MALLLCLSAIAGSVDVAVFLGAQGVFTAHVTGNLAMLGSRAIQGKPDSLLLLWVLPAFVAGVAVTRVLDAVRPGVRPALLLHAGLLVALAALAVGLRPPGDGDAAATIAVGLLAAFAMGVQNALSRLLLPHAPSTAVMTGNVIQLVMALVDLALGPEARGKALAQMGTLVPCVAGFAAGCVAGTAGWDRFGWGVTLLPAAMAVLAVALPVRK